MCLVLILAARRHDSDETVIIMAVAEKFYEFQKIYLFLQLTFRRQFWEMLIFLFGLVRAQLNVEYG